MDTLSSSVSTLKVPSLPPSHPEFHHFKSTPYAAAPNRPPQPQAHVFSTSKPNLITKTKPFSHKGSTSLVFSSSSSSSSSSQTPSSPIFYRKPASGYAAAVVDVAQSSNSLHLVQKDVRRLLGFLKNVNFESALVGELKGQVMREVVEQGRFHRHLVAVVKILMKKNKLGIVKEVLEEFERIYEELCGTRVVLVSSATKMGEDQLFGIAKNVQKLSGAAKVKVRNLVRESSPSYAV